MTNKVAIVIFIATIIVVAGFLFFRNPQPKIPLPNSFTTLTSAQLSTILKQKDFFFVNVHIPYEGEIKSTDAFIPYDKITDNLDKLPKNKNAKIVLYCQSGRMSEIAARELIQLGYTQVSHLSGGMVDWKNNGYKIIEE